MLESKKLTPKQNKFLNAVTLEYHAGSSLTESVTKASANLSPNEAKKTIAWFNKSKILKVGECKDGNSKCI